MLHSCIVSDRMFFKFYGNEIKFVYIYSYFFLPVTVSGKGENGKAPVVSL